MSDENDQTIVVTNNGPLRVIGSNITIKDAAGNTFGLAGRTVDFAVPLRALREQTVLRREPRASRLSVRSSGQGSSAARA